jgi:hypothetical protein
VLVCFVVCVVLKQRRPSRKISHRYVAVVEGSLLVFGRFGGAAALECLRQWENMILCAKTGRVGHGVGFCGRRHQDD